MIDVREYIDPKGRSAFGRWFDSLNLQAAAKVTTSLERIAQGNFSNLESVGERVSEYKIDWGPGYRIYFGKDGEVVIFVGGGAKKRQAADIASAKEKWTEYKRRKRLGEPLEWR